MSEVTKYTKNFDVVVHTDAFDNILENAWTDMVEIGIKGRIVCQIAIY